MWCLAHTAVLACELELVIAMDVSRSVDRYEFDLMRYGTADAFRDPEVIDLIRYMEGGMRVTLTQWSGPKQQKQMIPWSILTSPDTVTTFAQAIEDMERAYRYDLTAPAEGILHAHDLFSKPKSLCKRRVIDVSGDGVKNQGSPVRAVTQRLGQSGTTINGLVIQGDRPDPLAFYELEIVIGPMSFIEIADGYEDFPRAMLRKLIKEMSPLYSEMTAQTGRKAAAD